MRRIGLMLLLSAWTSISFAQEMPNAKAGEASIKRVPHVRAQDLEASASASREVQEKLYHRMNQSAKRAIDSMCVECLGARYNRSGPKTPLILSDELSTLSEQPQLEQEP